MTWVLIFAVLPHLDGGPMVVGHYSSHTSCMEMGYRVQKAMNVSHARFYCIEETK